MRLHLLRSVGYVEASMVVWVPDHTLKELFLRSKPSGSAALVLSAEMIGVVEAEVDPNALLTVKLVGA